MSMLWSIRMKKQRGRQASNSCIDFDLSKDLKENLTEVLVYLCRRYEVSKAKKVAHLNGFVKYLKENEVSDFGYSDDELYRCFRVCLLDPFMQIRAGALRALRFMLHKEQDVLIMNKLQYPYFIARSMDIYSRGDIERSQALKLTRKMLLLAPQHFSPALARSIISIANAGIEQKDRMFRAFLGTLCELSVLNTSLFISCGGAVTVARATTTNLSAQIAEVTVGVLLRLLSNPETRENVSLLCLAAPYCEVESAGLLAPHAEDEERDDIFATTKWAVLSVLRSFTGVMHFCHPNEYSGIKAISDILYVDRLEIRGAVLELFYELLGLPLPTWTDEPDVVLAAVDPRRYRDSWKLSEGFVAAEGRTILMPLSSYSPNIADLHLALLVYVLLNCGLHKALAETIISSDTFISVRAAVLLGALLHLAHSLLPPEVCDIPPPLPNLLQQASAGKHQALAAVAILSRMQAMMRSRPTPASLFMDRLLQTKDWLRPSIQRDLRRHSNVRHWLKRESAMTQMLRDSRVNSSQDAHVWNWSAVRSLLRSRDDAFMALQDNNHKTFIKNLVRYFKPSSNTYSRIELATYAVMAREITLAGCDLINFLLEMNDTESKPYLFDLIGDVSEQIMAIRMSNSPHDCLFSPRNVSITCCQKYFLFIGQMSHSSRGLEILDEYSMLNKLQDLALTAKNECYVKLVISCLDYLREGKSRKVLQKIVNESPVESTRLYATQFLRILLRARKKDANQWAIEMLLHKLNDTSHAVALSALEALHEACEEPEYLEVMLLKSKENILNNWDQWMKHLGDRGHLLKIRLYSLRSAFASLPSASEELERWLRPSGLAERYAGLVEREINDALTRRQRGVNGSYQRRTSEEPMSTKDVLIPPHLVGQLVQHEFGMQLLIRRNILQRFARIVQRFKIECGSSGKEGGGGIGLREDGKTDEKRMIEAMENSRLETIVDSEVTENKPSSQDARTPLRTGEAHGEIRRKLSQDDSRRTTPEKSWRSDIDPREELDMSETEVRLMKVKAALWVLGHAGTSEMGVELLSNMGIIELMTSMVETCPYYGVRAITFYALSLVGTCRAGADALAPYNWLCVRYKRGARWPVVIHPPPPSSSTLSISNNQVVQQATHSPSKQQQQQSRHQRSLSDGKPDIPELPPGRRQRNRSESAATDLEARKFVLPDRGDTPSPIPSAHRLSQQDAEGLAKLRSLQRHRKPSFSHNSLEQMYSLDGRLSLQSLSEYEATRNWTRESVVAQTPPPSSEQQQRRHQSSTSSTTSSQHESDEDYDHYMGICLPQKLSQMFPEPSRSDTFIDSAVRYRMNIELRQPQGIIASELSTLLDSTKPVSQIQRIDMQQRLSEVDSDHLSPIPTIILEERGPTTSSNVATEHELSVNESDSEAAPGTSANHLELPGDSSRSKQRTSSTTSRQYASDADEESVSEYETTMTDHTRICLVCFREKSVSKDSVCTEPDFRKTLDRTRKEILKHTQRLANPVFYKQSRQMLLMLRQQHPDIFEDECIYSEVAAHLANNTYRIQARRFLQELFLDSCFDKLYEEPATILKQNTSALEDSQSSHVPKSQAVAVIVTPSRRSSDSSDIRVNGRLGASLDQRSDQLSGIKEEASRTPSQASSILNSQKSSDTNIRLLTEQRRNDEKIIAEILRPEERIRLPRSSGKMPLKATGINTAISLD